MRTVSDLSGTSRSSGISGLHSPRHRRAFATRGRIVLAILALSGLPPGATEEPSPPPEPTPSEPTPREPTPAERIPAEAPPGAIPWVATPKEAEDLAASSGKPLLVDFGAQWCGFCKKLDRETFGDERVIRLVRDHFVPLRVDTQKDPELARKHAVTGLPTVLFVTPGGEELHRIVGFVPPEDFLAQATRFAAASRAIEELKLAAEKEPASVDAQRAYARALFAAGNYDGARQVLEKALAAAAEGSSADRPRTAGLLLDLGDALRLGGKPAEACEAYRKLVDMDAVAGGGERRSALLPLARLLVSRKAYGDALAVLDVIVGDASSAADDRLQALFLRGYAHAVEKDVPGALADLKAAREADPQGRWGLRAGWILDIVESR